LTKTLTLTAGTLVNYTYAGPVNTDPASGKRYAFTGTNTGAPASGFTVSADTTITGNYDTQWLVSFAQSGIGTDTTATVVSVNSSDKTAANLAAGVSVWVTDGGSVTYDFKSPVAAGTGKRYTLNNVSGSLSGAAIHATGTITGNYDTQWLVSSEERRV